MVEYFNKVIIQLYRNENPERWRYMPCSLKTLHQFIHLLNRARLGLLEYTFDIS